MIWRGSVNGVPTSKAFYNFITRTDSEDLPQTWNWIWKIPCPQKIRFFIWLAKHERLPTNEYRVKLGLSSTDLCLRCNQHSESIIHVLRDCLKSAEVWKALIPWSKYQAFFSTHLSQWLKHNMEDNDKIGVTLKRDWMLLFAAVVWHVWKARNKEVFNGPRSLLIKFADLHQFMPLTCKHL